MGLTAPHAKSLASSTSFAFGVFGFAAICFAPPPRAELGQSPFLHLSRQTPVPLLSLEGGGLGASVVSTRQPDGRITKQAAEARYAPLEIACRAADSVAIAGPFIAAAGRAGEPAALAGRWGAMNAARTQVISGADFSDGQVLRWELGALDAASREAVRASIVLDPGRVVPLAQIESMSAAPGPREAAMIAANFRVSIAGLDTRGVSRVGPIVVERAGFDRSARIRQPEQGGVDAKNFVLEVSASRADDFEAWARRSLVQGQADQKTVTIELLHPNMRDVLMTMTGEGVGVVSLTPVAIVANSEAPAKVTVECYVERWTVGVTGEGTYPGTGPATNEPPRRRPGIEFRIPIPLPGTK